MYCLYKLLVFAFNPVMDLPLGNGHWTDAEKGGRIGHGSVQTQSNCSR